MISQERLIFANQIANLIKYGYTIIDPRGKDVTEAMLSGAERDIQQAHEEIFDFIAQKS